MVGHTKPQTFSSSGVINAGYKPYKLSDRNPFRHLDTCDIRGDKSMTLSKQAVHLTVAVIWGVYGIIIGSLAILTGFSGAYIWDSIIVAIVGNSAHLVTFSLSKTGLSVEAMQPPKA